MATMRIYVGGLGETVREEDIQNTFSKLGAVESVEFVRTKGRSFAYIDFVPSSDKSAAKLFSTYNGCAWKGGKLRLEKAKEHYLERMKREWAEEAELANKTHDDDDVKKVVPSGGHEETLDETSQIRMYIPRLRKVRPLPYKGTGKHKYSFQRLQVASHAAHFCDCVEHAVDVNTSSMKDGGMNEDEINMMNSVLNKFLEREPRPAASRTSSQVVRRTSIEDGGMNEDEINMMGSVLNKFLDRENHSTAPGINSQVAAQGGAALSDHLPDDQNLEDDSTDDDNIIINAVARPNDMSHLLESMKKQTGLHTKMARPNKVRTSAHVHSQNNVGIQKGMGKNFRQKAEPFQVDGSDEELEFSIPNRKRAKINQSERKPESLSMKEESGSKKFTGNTLQQRGQVIDKDDSLALSPPLVHGGVSDSEAHPEAAAAADNSVKLGKVILESPLPEQLNEVTNTDPKHVTAEKADKGASCSQKSSWMRLIGSASNSPFSISQILPETEKSMKGMQSSGAQRKGSALKRKRENTDEDLDSRKGNWVVASKGINMHGFRKKNHKLGIQRSAAPQ